MMKLNVPKVYKLSELETATGLEKSTIRYYLKNVLDEYVTSHFGDMEVEERKATLYPAQILDRLKFIKMAKEELKTASGDRIKPSIAELRSWMKTITDEEVSAVLHGTELLEFGTTKVENGKRIIETIRGEKLTADSQKYGRQIPGRESDAYEPHWNTIRFGSDLKVSYRKKLKTSKKRQLEMIGALMQSIIDED